MSVWTKICGVTTVADALMAVDAGADALGLNFHPASVRCVSIDLAAKIVAALPGDFPTYAVVVDRSRSDIEDILGGSGVQGVQFHGTEPVGETQGWGCPVIRAISARSATAVRDALVPARGHGTGSRVLVDSAKGGGSGVLVDPDFLGGLDLSQAILAGGLTPENVADIVRRFRPYGVDCAGGVESQPGVKDPRRTKEFIGNAKSVDHFTAR